MLKRLAFGGKYEGLGFTLNLGIEERNFYVCTHYIVTSIHHTAVFKIPRTRHMTQKLKNLAQSQQTLAKKIKGEWDSWMLKSKKNTTNNLAEQHGLAMATAAVNEEAWCRQFEVGGSQAVDQVQERPADQEAAFAQCVELQERDFFSFRNMHTEERGNRVARTI